MTLTDWISGKPERVGWYNASTERDKYIVRHWNGEWWSYPLFTVYSGVDCMREFSDATLERVKQQRAGGQRGIEFRGLTEEYKV